MSLKIPKEVKKEFHKGIHDLISSLGRQITVFFKPYQVQCPNCLFDNSTHLSSNVYDARFIRPVNIFAGQSFQQQIYPVPFNVTSAPIGIQYDPTIPNPKVLRVLVCPVCTGKGVLEHENSTCIKAIVDHSVQPIYGVDNTKTSDLSAGLEDYTETRVKTFECNFDICEKADHFIIDQIRYNRESPVRLKGLGGTHLLEFFVSEVAVGGVLEASFTGDPQLNIEQVGQSSNQASSGASQTPPMTPGGDDEPW